MWYEWRAPRNLAGWKRTGWMGVAHAVLRCVVLSYVGVGSEFVLFEAQERLPSSSLDDAVSALSSWYLTPPKNAHQHQYYHNHTFPNTRDSSATTNNKLHSIMSSSPPPEDRAKADAEAKAKEDAEQAALPYKWTQTIKDLDITISIDGKYKGKDLDVKFTKTTIKAGIKGQEPILEVGFFPTFLTTLNTTTNTNIYRAPYPTPSTSMNPPGPSKACPVEKKSVFTSTKSTRCNGGRTSSPPHPRSMSRKSNPTTAN